MRVVQGCGQYAVSLDEGSVGALNGHRGVGSGCGPATAIYRRPRWLHPFLQRLQWGPGAVRLHPEASQLIDTRQQVINLLLPETHATDDMPSLW